MKIPIEEKEETKLQMAPMIDMVFLLVIFFMTASHMSSMRSLPINMPNASKGTVPKDRPDRWVVNILADGTIYSGQTPISVDELHKAVAARTKIDPNVKVYLRADKETPHRQVKKVMAAMASAGVGDFIFGVYALERQ